MVTAEDSEITLAASDTDGDPLAYAVASGPAHGTLSPLAGNKLTYTPAATTTAPTPSPSAQATAARRRRPAFPDGLLVVQDGVNAPDNQNYKLVPLGPVLLDTP